MDHNSFATDLVKDANQLAFDKNIENQKKRIGKFLTITVAKKRSKRDKDDPLQSEKVCVRRKALNADIKAYLSAGGQIHVFDNSFPDGTPRPKHLDRDIGVSMRVVGNKKKGRRQGPRHPTSGKDNLGNRYI